MGICEDHDFELDRVVQSIRGLKAETVLIQLPEGFQVCFSYIVQRLHQLLGRELRVVLSLNPSYGPCLADEGSAEEVKADLVLHFGHADYPLHRPKARVVYVPVEYIGVDLGRIASLTKALCADVERVCAVSTSQHIRLCKRIEETLNGFCSFTYRGVVYGCIPANVEGCDALVVVAGGRFSCISQYLALSSRHRSLRIYCLDPYSYTLWRPDEEAKRVLKVRAWKVAEARGSRRWLVVQGFYGQSRPELVEMLVDRLRARGAEVSMAKVLKLDRGSITNLGKGFDVVVVALCPYLAFDFYDLDIPVLTVGEALMALEGTAEGYVYPW